MRSMTGFGRSDKKSSFGRITVELSSVNNRFLEYSFRLPRMFQPIEAEMRTYIGKHVERGKISVSVSYDPPENSSARFYINVAAAKSYAGQLKKIQKDLKLSGEVSVSDLIMLPEIAKPEIEVKDSKALWKALEPVLKKGLSEFVAMRSREGLAMANDMAKRLKMMEKLALIIEKKSKGSAKIYAKKLAERIEVLTDKSNLDAGRLEQEVAYFADKSDISEECTRFKSHIKEYNSALKKKEPVGRRVNFVLQEMNREVNTMGSKSADFGISSTVISLKEEIEKLRELVQNVE